jgi:hypothetical protein
MRTTGPATREPGATRDSIAQAATVEAAPAGCMAPPGEPGLKWDPNEFRA